MKNDNRELSVKGVNDLNRLERFVEEICDYYNINNEYFGNILLATTEAATILLSLNDRKDHGEVVVKFDRNRKGLIFNIKIADSADLEEAKEDILDREIRKHKLAKDIFIIKALTDEITISVNARSIVLVFYVSSMNYEKSIQRINKLKDYWTRQESFIDKKNG
jgi:ABC-type uncharacterized transport system ATPase subunit